MRCYRVAAVLLALCATPAFGDQLRLNLGLAGEMSWEKSNGESTGGNMTSPVGVLELAWRPRRGVDVFLMHISSIPDGNDNYGINLMGLRMSFGN